MAELQRRTQPIPSIAPQLDVLIANPMCFAAQAPLRPAAARHNYHSLDVRFFKTRLRSTSSSFPAFSWKPNTRTGRPTTGGASSAGPSSAAAPCAILAPEQGSSKNKIRRRFTPINADFLSFYLRSSAFICGRFLPLIAAGFQLPNYQITQLPNLDFISGNSLCSFGDVAHIPASQHL
jgi:hypothetical protein